MKFSTDYLLDFLFVIAGVLALIAAVCFVFLPLFGLVWLGANGYLHSLLVFLGVCGWIAIVAVVGKWIEEKNETYWKNKKG